MLEETTSALEVGDSGLLVIQRLHRMVRHGYRPWLGYDVASQQDKDVHLRRKRSVATIFPDGTVAFTPSVAMAYPRIGADGHPCNQAIAIAGDDHENFDALFPPNTPNKRNLTRRLYEIGL